MKDLKEKYQNEVLPLMMEKFGYKNKMAVPKIEKVVLNTSFGKLLGKEKGEKSKKIQEEILDQLSLIAGQKAVLTFARKSIAGFKIKKGQAVGAKVTLRRKRMWDFLTRLIHIVLPRTRDFKGIPKKSIDKEGNLTLGFREQSPFPEVAKEKSTLSFGLEVTIVTTTREKEKALELFKLLGFPFKKD